MAEVTDIPSGLSVTCDADHGRLGESDVVGCATHDDPDAEDGQPNVRKSPRLTVVIPLFNEAESIERLMGGLDGLKRALADKYVVELLFVDDGSRDATCDLLARAIAGDERARLVRHTVNQGIAAAIATGIGEAKSEIVASIDADCTYEPVQLLGLLSCFRDGVDLVVASPYHPHGHVEGVPAWRLAISRRASRLYGMVLRNQLHTYTSCFRVYRRSAVVGLPVRRGGFVGVVELLWQVDRQGGTVVECPAVLSVRTTGQSKMRVARTAFLHLGLLAEAVWKRVWKGSVHRELRGGHGSPYSLGKT